MVFLVSVASELVSCAVLIAGRQSLNGLSVVDAVVGKRFAVGLS